MWTLNLREDVALRSDLSVDRIVENMALAVQVRAAPGIDSVQAAGPRQLRIYLSTPADSLPPILADPELLIYRGLTIGGREVLIPARDRLPPIEMKLVPAPDGRDELDRGADLMVTRDPALIDYAAGRPMFRLFPLPWSRTYLLLQPSGAEPLEFGKSEEERRSLARDAVQVDARPAEPPDWWNASTACSTIPGSMRPAPGRIVYQRDDPVARALAERLVALAGTSGRLRAAGLEPAAFAASLRSGAEQAYIWAVPRRTFQPCGELTVLAQGMRAFPLIDTRAHAIVRRGAPPLEIDWDGTVRVADQ